MGLALEIIGLVLFLGAHVFVSLREEPGRADFSLGHGPYLGLFSVVSIVGIILIGYGFARYRAEGMIPIWYPPHWTRHIVVALMWPASIAVVAAYIPGNIKRVLKHPMLVGVKTLGRRASVREWRSRRNPPVRLGAGSGRATTASRSSAAAMPARRRFRLAAGETISSPLSSAPVSIWRSASCSIRSSCGVPVFGPGRHDACLCTTRSGG